MRPRRIDWRAVAQRHLADGDPTGWFDPVYAAGGRRGARVPWHAPGPHSYLVDWLDAPVVPPPGDRTVVVGCGLGDDAVELDRRGWDVTAFDVAPSAVRRARRRDRRHRVDWRVADLLRLPDELAGAFDLVVEIHTVPWLPGVVRDAAMTGVAALAAPGGVVVAVTVLATSAEVARERVDPPWPQAPSELATYRAGGLERVALEHPDPDGSGLLEARVTLRRER